MKKDDVRIGATFLAKVSGAVVPVRINEEKWRGDKHTGWTGTNTLTGRSVYIKSAQRLRAAVGATNATEGTVTADVGPGAADAEVVGESAKAASPAPRAAKAAKTGKGAKAKKAGKTAKAPKPPKAKADRPMSCLEAAAKVLGDSKEPLRAGAMIEAMEKKGLWKSKAGKTPEATLYAAIIREIRDKGVDSRFEKKDRGLFAAAGK